MQCLAGAYRLGYGCALCGAGTYQPSTGSSATACTACPTTQWQDQTGQTSCKDCSTGYYRSSATAQSLCPLGYACTNCGATLCTVGTSYADQQGSTSCKAATPCGLGQYQNVAATSSSNRAVRGKVES